MTLPKRTSRDSFTVVGLGEALFDRFSPQQVVLGGAPVNLAVHAHQLLQTRGRGVVASAVGQDQLGQQLIADVAGRGMTTDYIAVTTEFPTSTVEVEIDPQGETQYEIKQGVAWDHLSFSDNLAELATSCSAVCFGTLAQRSSQSRDMIQQFLTTAESALRVLDINLRQRFYSAEIVLESLQLVDVVKLNEHELPKVRELLGLPATATSVEEQVRDLLRQFELNVLVLTRGEAGTVLFTSNERVEGTVPSYPRQQNSDNVGAGDACCAAIIAGLLMNKPLQEIVNLANRVGAFVASQPGATPILPGEILAQV